MDAEILKVLKEMSQKLDNAKSGGGGDSKLQEIKEGDDPKEVARKMAANKAIQEQNAKRLSDRAEELRLEAQLNLALGQRQERMDNLLKLEKAKEELMKQRTATNEENTEAIELLDAEIAKTDKLLNSTTKLREQAKKQTVAQKQARKAGDDLFRGIAGSIGLATKAQDTYAGKLFKMLNVLKEPGGGTAFFKGIGMAIATLPLAILDSIIKHTMDMIFALDEAQNSISALTQAGDKYNATMSAATFENVRFGISAAETGKALGSLHENFFAFTQLSAESQQSMIVFTSQMEKLGVSGESTAQVMNFFNKTVGQTATDAQESAAQILMMGQDIGLSAQRISRDLMASTPKLAVYGNRAKDIFSNLAAMAHRSGVSMQGMLAVADKFDTFQGAAETVGKLNAILGSQMSATEMLMMTEDQRIETLILQVQTSGMAFRDMDRFTKKAIAAAAGISDMNEAQRIFGGSMGDYQKAQAAMAKEAEAQERVDAAVKKALPAKQKLMIAFNLMVSKIFTDAVIAKMHQFTGYLIQLAEKVDIDNVVASFLGFVDTMVDLFHSIKDNWGTWVGYYTAIQAAIIGIPILTGAIRSYMLMSKLSAIQTAATTSAELTKQGIAPLTATQTAAQTTLTQANTAASTANASALWAQAAATAAIGAAILMAGVGIYIAVQGFVDLANAMADMKDNTGELVSIISVTISGFVGMTFALAGMGGASAGASGPIMAVGFAILMMGAGIALASVGMALMAQSFGNLNAEGLQAMAMFTIMTLGLAMLAPSLLGASVATGTLGAVAVGAAPGLGVFALAIGGVTLAIGLVIHMITRMFDSMAKFGKSIRGTAADSKAMAAGIWDIVYAATAAGNPITLSGLTGMTMYAKAKKTTISIGGAGMKALAETMNDTANMASSFEGVAASMIAIANGVSEIDSAIGSGKRRVEIISTLTSLASISTAEVGNSVFNKQAASSQQAQQAIKVSVQNEFKDLNFVVDDGRGVKTFQAYIKAQIPSVRK